MLCLLRLLLFLFLLNHDDLTILAHQTALKRVPKLFVTAAWNTSAVSPLIQANSSSHMTPFTIENYNSSRGVIDAAPTLPVPFANQGPGRAGPWFQNKMLANYKNVKSGFCAIGDEAAKAEDITDSMQKVLEYIRYNMTKAQDDMVKRVNPKRKDIKWNIGDMVFLSGKNIVTTRPSKKLDDKRYGPFKVIEKVEYDYKLELPVTMKIHAVFALKLLSTAATDPLPDQKKPEPKSYIINGQKEWELEKILKSKKPYGRLKYRVQWKNEDKDYHWYNADGGEFKNAQELVEEFHRQYPDMAR